jgi:hypothetical protein
MVILDRELINNSWMPILPDGIVRNLHTVEVKLPPQGSLVDGTQNVEGLFFLVAFAQVLGARSLFEIGPFTGVTAFTLAVNLPQLVVDPLDLPMRRVPALEVEKADRTYISSQSRRRLFEGRPESCANNSARG